MGERLWAVFKTLLFTVLLPGSVTVLIPYYFLRPGSWPEFTGTGAVGVALIALGATGYLWCAWNFAWVGVGTPAPIDPPRRLVAVGLYRFVRNPMYVAVVSVLFGESMLFRSGRVVGYALIACLACHLFVVFYEERALRKKFGADYEAYCKTVPRWLPKRLRL
jgi:protein-S-isoprenylcysteine O-methyltransferase Ste14